MKNLRRMIIMAIGLLWAYSAAEMPEFMEHVIYKPLGGGKTGYGDFNNDGNLDVTAGPAKGAVYWFQNPGDFSKEWTRHEIDPNNGGCVGGEPADVDGDGLVDFISHGMWYRNDKANPGEKFEKFTFAGGGTPGKADGCHDFIAADINLDGKPDAMNHGVSWWENPGGEDATKPWEEHVVVTNPGYWGAIAPHGFGDVDGDGDNDVVGIGNWFKNVDGAGKDWEKIHFSSWATGTENRTWVADLDGDGDQDIAQAEGDGKDGRAAWHQNLDGKGGEWKTVELPGIIGDLHSVGGLDFDNDGDNDIFTGQNGGGENNEWVIFENTDGKGTFERRVIYKGYGAHESVYADFDADGDIDIFSKCWCGGGAGVILENKLDRKPPGAPGTVTVVINAENQVEVSWPPPADTTGKLKYIVYRNDVALDTVTTEKYVDSTAKAGEPYNYTVSALSGTQEGEKSVPKAFTAIYSMGRLKKQLSFRALISLTGKSPELEVVSDASGQFSIELYNMQGARLAVQSGEGQHAQGTISLKGLKDGIYIVRLNVPQGSVIQRLFLSR